MTPTPTETTGATSSAAVDLIAYLPLIVAVIGLAGLLVAAAWAARSAILVRLLDTNQQAAERFTVFQQNAVAAMNELGVSLARYAERPNDLAAAVREAAENRPAGATSVTISLDDAAAERVRLATDAWRLCLAQAHAFGGQGLADALAAVDRRRESAVQHLNAKRWDEAREAITTLREHDVRQAYRRLQIMGVHGQIGAAQLLRTWSLRNYLRRWEGHLQAEAKRGETMIDDAEREHAAKVEQPPSPEPDAARTDTQGQENGPV